MNVPAAMSASVLMDEAASRAGSDEWGDLAFTTPLALLLESCAETESLTSDGWRVLRSVVLRRLRNRLALQSRLRRHPDLAVTPQPAVVITGLPRTGTTLLHNLLSLDGELRALRLWEALRPFPTPGEEGPDRGALVQQAQSWLATFYGLAPGMRAIHPLTAEGPEECDALLQNSFASQHLDDMFDAPDYSAWFATDPLGAAYCEYALQLAALSEPAVRIGAPPPTWVLKSPGHLGHLDGLLDALPGAVVLHCHRDPLESVPSYASLIRTVRAPHVERLDPVVVGRQALERSAQAVQRAMEVRHAVGSEPFVDVSYARLVGDVWGVVSDIYRRLDRPLLPALRFRMERWLLANPQHVHGPHRYGLDDFGLHAQEVTEAFTSYTARFGGLVAAS